MSKTVIRPTTKGVRTLKDGEKVVRIGAEIYADTHEKLVKRNVKISAFIREALKHAVG